MQIKVNQLRWTRLLPRTLRSKIENWPEFKKIIENVNWLFWDKAVQVIVAIAVGIFVVRYLGPELYGTLSYSVAFASLFTVFAGLNIGEIAVREIVEAKFRKEEILGTLFAIRFIGGIVAIVVTFISVVLLNGNDSLVITLVFLISLQNLLVPFVAIQNWFTSKVEAKPNVISRNFAIVIGGLLRIVFIALKLPLIYFAIAILAETTISYMLLVVYYKRSGEWIGDWKFNGLIAGVMAKSGWPLLLASIFNTIYNKIDQVIVKNMLDNTSLGNYAAAVKISENFNFLAVSITSSVFPAMIYLKKQSMKMFLVRIQKLFDFLLWSSITIAIIISILSRPLTVALYGAQYNITPTLLAIHIWGIISIFLLSAARRVLIAKDLTKINFASSFAGGISIIFFNLLLIPRLGIFGSAYANVISSFISFAVLIFFKSSRESVIMAFNSFNLVRIYRYTKHFLTT